MSKFATRNFAGKPHQHFLVSEETFKTPKVSQETSPSHHIVIVDASGSMWGDMKSLKTTIEKLWTLDEFMNSSQKVSLLSYSSTGDLNTHFAHVPITQVMASGSAEIEEIRGLRCRGLTCISQALTAAADLCVDGELTAITLHSDGYANDASPSDERRRINQAVAGLVGKTDVYVNTIAHRSWCDFNLLSHIANSLSGVCVQAGDIKAVYAALHDTSKRLDGTRVPTMVFPLGEADFQVYVGNGRINGTTGDLKVTGVAKDSKHKVFKYTLVTEAAYAASTESEVVSENSALYVFAKANLALGKINVAKYAVVSTRNKTLLDAHSRAMTNNEIASFSSALEDMIFNTPPQEYTSNFGVDTSVSSVISILRTMSTYSENIKVNSKLLVAGYKRRGVRRLDGVRLEDGTLEEPWVDTEPASASVYKDITSVDLNRSTATANLKVCSGMNLVNRATRKVISNVAGVPLALKDFKNYTIISDGVLNVSSLSIRIDNKRTFKALKKLGAVSGTYLPNNEYKIELTGRPLVSFEETYSGFADHFDTLANYRVLIGIIEAITKSTSVDYTDEQLEELKRHFITPALYLSLPSTNSYTSLDTAVADGYVDFRQSYNINIGTPQILSLSNFASANAYLKKRFVLTINKEVEKKPTFGKWWDSSWSTSVKALTKRTKLDSKDDIQMAIFESFLGYNDPGLVSMILKDAGADEDVIEEFAKACRRELDKEDAVDAFADALSILKKAEDSVFNSNISPLAFYVGTTGLIPDEFEAVAMDATELVKKFPTIKLKKPEKEATFFSVGGALISIYVKSVPFSTDKKAA